MDMKIVLADDHSLFREGLKSLIQEHPDLEIVGETGNGRDAVKLCRELWPDIVIMDVAMPELNGIEATRQIVNECPGIKIIAVSMHSSRRFVVDMLQAGASGYLLKDCAFQELSMAISAVQSSQVYLSPSIASVVVEKIAGSADTEITVTSRLTPREREVLQLLAEGKSSLETANRLHLSVKTVQTHRRNIMEKLNLHNLANLTKYAIREGLISPDD
ncbi:MAG: response regulator transcription factor [Deltaproteobacteria bacterium]|nr:response regulator transcription factor [Deltaproteobacteria bacterium]MBW2053117.1 response regulator transcription factor [Deltaproteobacteria bacterium]MBW2141450.1 response regulator transcription factor [Deltaproteobacteria bacterium]MBW2322579.1 response regulator transcription factor [Deltaproteobacteria bacterium]